MFISSDLSFSDSIGYIATRLSTACSNLRRFFTSIIQLNFLNKGSSLAEKDIQPLSHKETVDTVLRNEARVELFNRYLEEGNLEGIESLLKSKAFYLQDTKNHKNCCIEYLVACFKNPTYTEEQIEKIAEEITGYRYAANELYDEAEKRGVERGYIILIES